MLIKMTDRSKNPVPQAGRNGHRQVDPVAFANTLKDRHNASTETPDVVQNAEKQKPREFGAFACSEVA
ncbi:hypothetical protein ALQ36_102261 [Pseudomonas syringae pv. primulae]|uniref:Uncharacterized protein n=1 Tax=Pseudomonas syringae pv. primulae TaxID=251707 RepID=A0A3M5TV56_9PSED|nr:hypothetical protein ALQ36_102261 [Pseudomonas syringae pv. primulae]RMR02680.1 hypothetical protein ALP92_102285 [Pseudomonas syringae pv. primulae]RMU37485.1 hypothetical protein ALP30_102502 [Pseudomonas syringae pv. primulae]